MVSHLKYNFHVREGWPSRTFWKFRAQISAFLLIHGVLPAESHANREFYFILWSTWGKEWHGQYRSDRTVCDAPVLCICSCPCSCSAEFKCSGNNIKLVSPLSDVVLSYQSAKDKCAEIGGIPPSLAALSCLRSYLALKQDGNEYWVGGQSARTRHENVAHDSKLRIVQVTAMLKVACEITCKR